MPGYAEIVGLETSSLKDSRDLGVYDSDGRLSFDLEAVLAEQHPPVEAAESGEVHSVRRLAVMFSNVREVDCMERHTACDRSDRRGELGARPIRV
jgi:hypothetical protein